ncbi:MAG: hypothetical protein HQL52_04285 [Magnetococcales bacterium]|nr:hypothetical protein [Magnetococcales bacterium]
MKKQQKKSVRGLFRRWFVEYNPLYFFSALCILLGVFLVSQSLEDLVQDQWSLGQVILFSVVQAYELLLIGGAWLLYRKLGQRRPGVILGMMAVLFLFDTTFRLESVVGTGYWGYSLAAIWVGLLGVKVVGLHRAFHLKINPQALALILAGGVAIGALPHLLAMPGVNKPAIFLIANWGLAFIGMMVLPNRLTFKTDIPLEKWGETVLGRISRGFWIALLFFYFYHLWNHIIWIGPNHSGTVLSQMVPYFFAVGLRSSEEKGAWFVGVVALPLTFFSPSFVAPTALAVAGMFAWRAWRRGEENGWVGTAFAGYFFLWSLGWSQGPPPDLPPPLSFASFFLVASLIFLAWRLQLFFAKLLLFFGFVIAAKDLMFFIQDLAIKLAGVFPKTRLGWGMMLLGVGFLALLGGLWINWMARKGGEWDKAADETEESAESENMAEAPEESGDEGEADSIREEPPPKAEQTP